MAKIYKHIDNQKEPSGDVLDNLPKLKISWNESKDEIWAKMQPRLEEKKIAKVRVLYPQWIKLSVAATFLLLISSFAVMRFYSKTINCEAGKHLSISLPDGSKVLLNSVSAVNYKPFWWFFSRKVSFEGEAYFEVEKGKKFEINSRLGTTTILGTSFTIYSRKDNYRVTCMTGKVKVLSTVSQTEVVILPNEMAKLSKNGRLEVSKDINASQTKAWVDDKFLFTSTPFVEVIEEIARQYGVQIKVASDIDLVYSGNFTKDRSVEDVLTLVCKPFNVNFDKNLKGGYQISRNK